MEESLSHLSNGNLVIELRNFVVPAQSIDLTISQLESDSISFITITTTIYLQS